MIRIPDQMVSQYIWGGKVHKVPVVYAFEVGQIESYGWFRFLLVFLYEDEQGSEPAFVPFAFKKGLDQLV